MPTLTLCGWGYGVSTNPTLSGINPNSTSIIPMPPSTPLGVMGFGLLRVSILILMMNKIEFFVCVERTGRTLKLYLRLLLGLAHGRSSLVQAVTPIRPQMIQARCIKYGPSSDFLQGPSMQPLVLQLQSLSLMADHLCGTLGFSD